MNIIVSINNAYINPLKVLLKSLIKCNSAYIYVYMLQAETVSAENIGALKKLLDDRGEILVIDVPFIKCNTRFSAASLSRIIAPFFLPETIHRALYLDADILVRKSLSVLYNMDMENKAICAIPDIELDIEGEYHFEQLEIKRPHHYVNSGVLLLDLDQYRKKHNLKDVLSSLTSYTPISAFIDQDFINGYFMDDIKYIDITFNHPAVWRSSSPTIVHYMGERKPWNGNYDLKYFFEYSKIWNEIISDKPLSSLAYLKNLCKKLLRLIIHR